MSFGVRVNKSCWCCYSLMQEREEQRRAGSLIARTIGLQIRPDDVQVPDDLNLKWPKRLRRAIRCSSAKTASLLLSMDCLVNRSNLAVLVGKKQQSEDQREETARRSERRGLTDWPTRRKIQVIPHHRLIAVRRRC